LSGTGTADNLGQITWTWLVRTTETPGTYIIVVTASSGSNATSQQINFTVQ
jgi:hypothetical protein